MIPQLYEKFQSWAKKGNIWIYADPHFDDVDCKYMDPNWITPEEQLKRINSKVFKNDTLIILGDVGNTDYIAHLKAGYKVLVCGNHDKGASNYKKSIIDTREIFIEELTETDIRKKFAKDYPHAKITINVYYESYFGGKVREVLISNNLFDEVYTGPLFIGEKLLLSHEPIDGIPFALNIHGHAHGRVGYNLHDDNHYNVCSNCVNYEPQNLNEILKTVPLKNIDDIHRITINKASEKE